ncbi:hypothetical protein ACWC24_20040 [Streptomyces sp. NPDC001443]
MAGDAESPGSAEGFVEIVLHTTPPVQKSREMLEIIRIDRPHDLSPQL